MSQSAAMLLAARGPQVGESAKPLAGLSGAEAARRLAASGENVPVPPARRHWLVKTLRKFAQPLIAILVLAAVASAFAGEWPSLLIILAVIVFSVLLEIVQEHRAESAAEALRRSVAVEADVVRDGSIVRLPIEQIVPGDVVKLRAGDLVPADGQILEARNAQANEVSLTGEPYAVEKKAIVRGEPSPAGTETSLFSGTFLIAGEATLLVTETGARTRIGGIAAALEAATPPTPLEIGLRRLGGLLLRLTLFLVLFVLLVQLALDRPPLESFLFAIALAVGLAPELLPMVMTVTLSRGAVRMAARQAIVKRLSAIHDLGAMSILCTDKTGTLTQARIALVGSVAADGAPCEMVGTLAGLNSLHGTGVRSALDEALLVAVQPGRLEGWSRIDDVPFDFERRRSSVLLAGQDRRILVVKGAPGQVIAQCDSIGSLDGAVVPLDGEARARIAKLEEEKAAEGIRLLAVAWRTMPSERAGVSAADEAALVLSGFCLFLDPPKSSATEAVGRLLAAGVRVKVISGDAAAVVQHVVRELRLPAEGLLSGTEIDGLNDKQLAHAVQDVDLFARISPDQKRRIVVALRAHGDVVGFLGDGINDAPAIRAADVGLSVDGASDVAREAADIVLLDQDLGVVADGIGEGRRTFSNIMKYVRMAVSSNFGNMLSIAVAAVALPFLPLLPLQILVNNLIYDLSELGIPFDAVDPEEAALPQHWDIRGILVFMMIMGGLSSVFDLTTFAALRLWFDVDPTTFRTAWFVESMLTQILVVFSIRTMRPAWLSRPHTVLVISALGALACSIAVVAMPFRETLGFSALPAGIWLFVVCLSLAYLLSAELAKRWPERLRRCRPARWLGHAWSEAGAGFALRAPVMKWRRRDPGHLP